MPAILERLVQQLIAKGHSKDSAYAIATSTLQRHGDLKKGTQEATAKGVIRGNMSPADRAIDRAMKRGKHAAHEYKYDPVTNRATLKKSKSRKKRGTR